LATSTTSAAHAGTTSSTWTNRATNTTPAGTTSSTWTNRATSTTLAATDSSTWANRATSTSGGSAADGLACLASDCGSRITSSAFQAGVATCQSHQAGYKNGCSPGHLHEALDASPDLVFLHDPEAMVPLFGYTGLA